MSVLDDWDTLAMRSTGSNSVVFEDVFVPEERVLADCPHGIIDPPLQVIFSIAFPIISAVYLVVAEAPYRAAVERYRDVRGAKLHPLDPELAAPVVSGRRS